MTQVHFRRQDLSHPVTEPSELAAALDPESPSVLYQVPEIPVALRQQKGCASGGSRLTKQVAPQVAPEGRREAVKRAPVPGRRSGAEDMLVDLALTGPTA